MDCPIGVDGAVVSVLVRPPRGWVIEEPTGPTGLGPPRGVRLRAMIDTGASITCLDTQVSRSLNAPPSRPRLLQGVSASSIHAMEGGTPVPTRGIVVTINGLDVGVEAAELPLAAWHAPFHVLIGRDILCRLRFQWDGPARTLTLRN